MPASVGTASVIDMELREAHFDNLKGLVILGRRIPPHLFAAAAALVGQEAVTRTLCDVADRQELGVEWRALLLTPTRLIYIADTGPTSLHWDSRFPGAETPPPMDVVAWAHPLSDIRVRIDRVFAHNQWDWTADMVWRIAVGGDSCTLGLFGDPTTEAGEAFAAELTRVATPQGSAMQQ